MKQQELDQLKEQAQLEREERKRADDERLQREEYQRAQVQALGKGTTTEGQDRSSGTVCQT